MTWGQVAEEVIREVHAELPKDAAYKDVTKALRAAYPFDYKRQWPYKCWLARRKMYLARRFPEMFPQLQRKAHKDREKTGARWTQLIFDFDN